MRKNRQNRTHLRFLETKFLEASTESGESILIETIRSWLPLADDTLNVSLKEDFAVRSLQVFMNLAGPNRGRLVSTRQLLVKAALLSFAQGNVNWLPTIPLDEFFGFFGIGEDRFYAVPFRRTILTQLRSTRRCHLTYHGSS